MLYELLSLATALLYSCSSIFTKKGLNRSNPFTAILVSLTANFLLLSLFYLVNPVSQLNVESIAFFALGGIIASFIGRTAQYISIEKIGVSVSSSVVGSSALFSAFTATLLLHESFSSLTYLGLILIITGIILLSQRRRGTSQRGWNKTDMIWSLGASICYGSSVTIRKMGLNITNNPIFGATIGATASLSMYLLYLAASQRITPILSTLDRSSLLSFMFSGICTGLAWIFSYTATSTGPVTIVSALVSTYPLFSIILSYLFLREEITLQILIGSFTIIIGVIIITGF
jgi:uncharacterized membrane protein